MKVINLPQGKTVLIDDGDFDKVKNYHWCLSNGGYVVANINKKKVYMHRFLLDDPPGVVSHINKNELDNRRCNLRILSPAQLRHTDGPRRGGSSSFKGVHWCYTRQKWVASIRVNGKGKHIGYYNAETAAALAYDTDARLRFGSIAYLNFPDGTP